MPINRLRLIDEIHCSKATGSYSAMSSSSITTFRRFKVFSTKKVSMQSGGTDQQKKFWLVESDSKSLLTIRPIDDQTWLPTGRAHPITLRELQKRYTPESEAYTQRIQENIGQHEGNLLQLNVPDKEAPPVNESVVISDFQKGIDLLKDGNLEKATAIFADMLDSEKPFEEKHKHLFNDFAIQLRKNKLNSQAIAFYTRALELSWSDEDENLHINLARVLYAEKQYAGCVQHLFDALRIVPGHQVARNFLVWLEQQKVVPKQYALQVKGHLVQKLDPDHDHADDHAENPESEEEAEETAADDVDNDIMQNREDAT